MNPFILSPSASFFIIYGIAQPSLVGCWFELVVIKGTTLPSNYIPVSLFVSNDAK